MGYSLNNGSDPDPPPRRQPVMTTTLEAQLKSARAIVNSLEFGTDQWEQAMVKVRQLVDQINTSATPEEFCSVDSGIHRTRLLGGRIV